MEIKLETIREMGFKNCNETAKVEATGDKTEIKKLLIQAIKIVSDKK
jgi:hypothetical protein